VNTFSFIFLVFLPSSGDRTLRQLNKEPVGTKAARVESFSAGREGV